MVGITDKQLQDLIQSIGPGTGQTREPKIEDPETFTGDRRKIRAFLTQCDLVFSAKPNTYAKEEARISYASGRLRGNAWDWVESSIVDGKSTYKTWKEFKTSLSAAFGEVDTHEIARHKLARCRQGPRSASTYWAEFQKIKNDLDYDDSYLIDAFKDGLHEEVRRQLAITENLPKEITKFAHQAISLDNKLYNYRNASTGERRNQGWVTGYHSQFNNQTTHSQNADPYGPKPMDLDATRRGRYVNLTEAERRRRRMNNLCMSCGKPGHFFYTCPDKRKPIPTFTPRRSFKVSEASVETELDDEEQGKGQVQA